MIVLTVPEIAGQLRISTASVYRRLGKWPHLRVGTDIRFTEEQVNEILALITQTPVAPAPTKSRPNVGTRANRNRS